MEIRENAPEVLARELSSLTSAPIKFSAITNDPYQTVERRTLLTRRLLKVLRGHGWPVMILTRSSLILRDLDVLMSLAFRMAGVSLPTLDEEVARFIEPRASTVAERLQVLDSLRAAGVPTFACIQPLLPGPVDAFADAVAKRSDLVRIDTLHGEYDARALFDDPRLAAARDSSWQEDRDVELCKAFATRGITVWRSHLPPRWTALGHDGLRTHP